MPRAGLTRSAVKHARDALVAQGRYPSINAIRVALGNTGSNLTIHRYVKELEEEEQERADVASAAERQQARAERTKLADELAALRAQLADTTAALERERDAHAETRTALRHSVLEAKR
jgi:hypothetical protein